MSDIDSGAQLPFSPTRQLAVLGHCLLEPGFFLHCRTKIEPQWFSDIRHAVIFRAMLEFYKQFQRPPTPEEIKGHRIVQLEKEPERSALISLILTAKNSVTEVGLDVLRSELTAWYHARLYREGMEKSSALYNQGRFEDAYKTMSEKMQLVRTSRFDDESEMTFSNPGSYLAEGQRSLESGLSTGLDVLDAALTPDGLAAPSLYRGDTTVILAPSNLGKTSTLITMAMYNILAGKNVLLLTHEGRPSDIREKILQCALMATKQDLYAMWTSDQGQATINRITRCIEKRLVYVPYNKAGMSVEDVASVIKRRQEERIAATGSGFDLLVDDYPAKLTTERAARGNLPRRNVDAIVYDYFVQMALEYQWHSLLAIQTNRQGSRDNRDAERLLTMEDVAESWDVMTMATNVLTLNRDAAAAANKRMTFYVAKSRSSEVGRAVVARTNFAACRTHGNSLGGTWYRGEDTLSDQIDRFLTTKNGQEITQADIQRGRGT